MGALGLGIGGVGRADQESLELVLEVCCLLGTCFNLLINLWLIF